MTYISRTPTSDRDVYALAARATAAAAPRRHRRLDTSVVIARTWRRGCERTRALPARVVLHLFVLVLVPVAYLVSQLPLAAPAVNQAAPALPVDQMTDFVAPIAPLSLDVPTEGNRNIPDTAFADIDALAVPSSLAPNRARVQPVAASIAAESANVRTGPGTNYDKADTLAAGTDLLVLARAGDWFKAQRSDGSIVWVMAELLALDLAAADLLPEATDIPVPPPLKVGTVVEQSLNLRDGPNTAYIGMLKLDAGAQLDLLARYDDWFQVQTADGQVGWVIGDYLAMVPGVAERVEIVTSIPAAHPPLVGSVSTDSVNLRGGPGTAYDNVGQLAAQAQLDLLGRYEDWFKVKAPNGATGWIARELVDVSAFVVRRVPTTRDIPALPQKQVAKPQVAAQSQATKPSVARQPAPALVPAAAAGNSVSFAMQFVGSRYVWGGASPSGFDCSGFTMYVYQQYGLKLPHSSEAQFSTRYGAIISNPADLQPGDIVFFVNTYKPGISHVGVYVGGGNVVQAMSPALGVGVANMNSGYWSQHYYSAIRPAL